MALEAILENILDDAKSKARGIIQGAEREAEKIIREGKSEAESLYRSYLDKEKALYEKQRQRLIVSARLEARQDRLLAKQELIGLVFNKLKASLSRMQLKKQQVSQDKTHEAYEDADFYLNKIRQDFEAKIAQILFE